MIQGIGQDIVEIPAFGHDITEVRAMGQLVWQKSIPDYLCFTALESGTFTLTIPAAVTADNLTYVEYSLDGRNWTRLTVDDTAQSITTPIIPVGGKVYWRGQGMRTTALSANAASCSRFSSDDGNGNDIEFNLSGCVFSLLTGDNLDTQDVSSYTFCHLFNSTYVVDASEMYFNDGTGLGRECREMFRNCTHLTKAPLLNHASLGRYSYYQMFIGCTNLSHIKCLATDISATDCLSNWTNGVAANGTFIKDANTTWPTGVNGIPTAWVVVEKRTMPSGYKQLLQVTSNGTAYIQLSFGFEETDEVAATFSVDTSQTSDKYIVCPQTWNNNSNRYGMGVHNYGQYTAAFGNRSTGNTILTPRTYNDGELHNWTYAAATFAVTDKSCSINITGYTFGGITTNLRLFYGYNSNTKGAISSYKHIKGSTTACDFVAAIRESDDTAGLYDLANDEFMTCNGLTAGEEI